MIPSFVVSILPVNLIDAASYSFPIVYSLNTTMFQDVLKWVLDFQKIEVSEDNEA